MHKALQILYQDAKQICINKPVGCAIQGTPYSPAGKHWHQLRKDCEALTNDGKPLHVVHRLDSDTSGALLLAKTATAARSLSQQFQQSAVGKTYLAIMHNLKSKDGLGIDGHSLAPRMAKHVHCNIEYTPTGPRLCQPDDRKGKSAITTLTLLEKSASGEHVLLQLDPETGRKHQLRLVCSQLLDAPIIGDFKYGYTGEKIDGHLLHCHRLSFKTWGKDGKMQSIVVEAPLPSSFHHFGTQVGLCILSRTLPRSS